MKIIHKILFLILLTIGCQGFKEAKVSIGVTDNTSSPKLSSQLPAGTNSVTLSIVNVSVLKEDEVKYNHSADIDVSVNFGSGEFVTVLPFTSLQADDYTSVQLLLDSISFNTIEGIPIKMGFPENIKIDAPGNPDLTIKAGDSVKIVIYLNLSNAIDFETGLFKGFSNNFSFIER